VGSAAGLAFAWIFYREVREEVAASTHELPLTMFYDVDNVGWAKRSVPINGHLSRIYRACDIPSGSIALIAAFALFAVKKVVEPTHYPGKSANP
jgi:hypothetical protein